MHYNLLTAVMAAVNSLQTVANNKEVVQTTCCLVVNFCDESLRFEAYH